MSELYDISVVVSTYNRCELLARLLESLVAQQNGDVRYEVIIVDNNSTDDTRKVVESFQARGCQNLQYVFEGQQGVSYGRNTGIARAVAPIIAFTDDDMLATPDWVAALKRAFDEHPEADFCGGRVEPRWSQPPPAWLLNRRHWMPLGIVSLGDQPFYSHFGNQKEFPTCNVAFRREVFTRIGGFAPEMQRVKDNIGNIEDYELCLRAWQARMQGLYLPDVKMVADVQLERFEKDYHRRWYRNNAEFLARLRHGTLSKILGADGKPTRKAVIELRFFGAPISSYSRLVMRSLRWPLSVIGRRDEALIFFHELRVLYHLSILRASYRLYAETRRHSHLAEVGGFIKTFLRNRGRMAMHVEP